MPPAGKLFAEPEDYGDEFENIGGTGDRRTGVVKYYNSDKVYCNFTQTRIIVSSNKDTSD